MFRRLLIESLKILTAGATFAAGLVGSRLAFAAVGLSVFSPVCVLREVMP